MRLPDTLFGRLVIVIALVIAANQLALYLFVRHTLGTARAQRMGELFAGQIELVRELHGRTGSAGAAGGTLALVAGVVAGAPPPPGSELAQAEKTLQARLGPHASLRLGGNDRLWLVWEGKHPFSLSLPPYSWRTAKLLFLYWKFITIALLAFIGALVALRQINRPLSRLVAAMEERGSHGLPVTAPPAGPREIQRLIQHYNRMLVDLRALLDERDLVLVGISHDLRTPLTRLRLGCEFLPDSAQSAREELIRDIQALDEILDQFIAFSRRGQGEDWVLCQLNDIVKEAVERFSRRPVGLRVICVCAPLPEVLIQPLGMRRLLDNLIDNARRYAPGEITVRTGMSGEMIELTVEDLGPGIPESLRPQLGRPFAGVSQGVSGTGLGIAIVWAIARAHDGEVLFENRPDAGLRVVLRFPKNHDRPLAV
ncbi:MAG: ATP-binding protein [Gammaproteobacteria bacterium]|nr:ATP-binding protein [Gammaproteobacteria bacterium]